jgi:hypothetical protein
LFDRGLCLPSGSNLSTADLDRVVGVLRAAKPKRLRRSGQRPVTDLIREIRVIRGKWVWVRTQAAWR